MTLDCSPCYEGRPDYDPSGGQAVLPTYALSRSRLFSGGTFFRSKLVLATDTDFQGLECNDIELEMYVSDVETTLIIYYDTVEVDRYTAIHPQNCQGNGAQGASNLRAAIAGNQYISMPARGSDSSDMGGTDSDCLENFTRTYLSGAIGPDDTNLPAIRTGPDRTLVYIASKENINGTVAEPPSTEKLLQFNYDTLQWNSFVTDEDCRPEGTACP